MADDSTTEIKEYLEQYRKSGELTDSDLDQILDVCVEADSPSMPAVLMEEHHGPASEEQTSDVRAQLSKLSIPQKMKAAMFGNEIVRGILVYDSNKMIQGFVLRNPRLLLPEVESFTKNPNISEHVIRLVAGAKEWMRYYSIKMNLVCNPKTPPDIALKWLRHLNEGDVKKLSRSKNIPQLVASTAQKLVAMHDAKK